MRNFCITCPESPAREKRAREHFDKIGLGCTFVQGIHGVGFGLHTVNTYEFDHPGSGYIIPQRAVGMHLSHYMMWSICSVVESEAFLILEDDALFEDKWRPRLQKALLDLPADADMLFIGSCNCTGKPSEQVQDEVWRVKWPQCTHAYVVFPKALPVLLATQRKTYAPIDISLIFQSFEKLNIYTVLPRLVRQEGTEIAP